MKEWMTFLICWNNYKPQSDRFHILFYYYTNILKCLLCNSYAAKTDVHMEKHITKSNSPRAYYDIHENGLCTMQKRAYFYHCLVCNVAFETEPEHSATPQHIKIKEKCLSNGRLVRFNEFWGGVIPELRHQRFFFSPSRMNYLKCDLCKILVPCELMNLHLNDALHNLLLPQEDPSVFLEWNNSKFFSYKYKCGMIIN